MQGKTRSIAGIMGFLGMFGLSLGFLGCGKVENPWPEGKSPRVLTTFPPLYCFAINVAGDHAAVVSLLTTRGPHDYSATPRDAIKLQHADVFFANGLGLDESFASKLKNSSGNSRLQLVLLGEGMENLVAMAEDPAHAHQGHSHGEHDPHVWLGIPEAVKMVTTIRDTLKKLDPTHAAAYDQNAAAYVTKLETLQTDGKALLANKKNRKLVTFHESLSYFARTFGLEIAGTIQARPGSEPSPSKLAELVKLCREKDVKLIAVEPQYPDNTAAKTLVTEISGAPTVIVDPIETAEAANLTPTYYEDVMRENLRRLAKALP